MLGTPGKGKLRIARISANRSARIRVIRSASLGEARSSLQPMYYLSDTLPDTVEPMLIEADTPQGTPDGR